MPLPEVGSLAPDFTLPSTGGGTVTLADFRGKHAVILAFFPLAFTSTCTTELCEFSEGYEEFVQAGSVVLPLSVDSVDTLKAYKAHGGFRVDMLSDFFRVVSRLYGVLIEAKNHSSRAYVLIDREGLVQWTWEETRLRDRRENAELLQRLAVLT